VRICPVCKLDYQPRFSSLQKTCNETSCMIKLVEMRRVKSAKAKDKKAFNQKDKRYWAERVKVECHKYVRERDKEGCFSCGATNGQMQAGHYKPQGSNAALRYFVGENGSIGNIYVQCVRCNMHLSGNLVPYRAKLVKMYGEAAVLELDNNNEIKTWTIDELKTLLIKFKALNKGLKDDQGA
jgi:hypothetical protein